MIPITNFNEVLYVLIVTFAIGYIFSGYIPRGISFFREDRNQPFRFAIALTAPAIILHEFGHKFASMFFGIPAYFHISWGGIGMGLVMRFLHFPFLLLLPGYVGIEGATSPVQGLWISFAGPLVNMVLYFSSKLLLRTRTIKVRNRKYIPLLLLTQKINLWLFIFNMLPIPPLDGYQVISSLIRMIF
jgi:Zn-dependent protease